MTNTEGDEFYKEHEDYIEQTYQGLDEDNRTEFETFMSDLYKERRTEINHHEELRRKLENAKKLLAQYYRSRHSTLLIKHVLN